jgi:hypothetical protein
MKILEQEVANQADGPDSVTPFIYILPIAICKVYK